jgi:hypothetical protein
MIMERAGVNVIDLLKIDIEGSELELLSEDADWLEQVRAISIEFHDAFRPGCTAVGESALARAGFELRLREPVSGAQYYVRKTGGRKRAPRQEGQARREISSERT